MWLLLYDLGTWIRLIISLLDHRGIRLNGTSSLIRLSRRCIVLIVTIHRSSDFPSCLAPTKLINIVSTYNKCLNFKKCARVLTYGLSVPPRVLYWVSVAFGSLSPKARSPISSHHLTASIDYQVVIQRPAQFVKRILPVSNFLINVQVILLCSHFLFFKPLDPRAQSLLYYRHPHYVAAVIYFALKFVDKMKHLSPVSFGVLHIFINELNFKLGHDVYIIHFFFKYLLSVLLLGFNFGHVAFEVKFLQVLYNWPML